MIISITLTEDRLKLIPFFFLQEKGDNEVVVSKEQLLNIGSHLLEDIAFALGRINEAIPTSVNDAEGRAFSDEFEKYMIEELYNYMVKNLYYIESLIHFYAIRGGLECGTYTCKDNEMIWTKEN